MKEPICLCGELNYKRYHYITPEKEFEVLECCHCHLARTWPAPLQGVELEEYYEEKEDYEMRFQNFALWQSFAHRTLNVIRKYKQNGNLLDVGCNVGIFVQEAQKYGFESYGVDFSEKAIQYGEMKLGLSGKLSKGTVIDQKYPNDYWDIITYMQCFEHLEDPVTELKEVRRVIKPSGILIIDIPRFFSIWRVLLGKHWYCFSPNQHIWQCGRRGVSSILEREGFKVIEARTRASLHHEITFDIRGITKFFIKMIAWITGTGDHLILVAQKK